MTCSSFLFIHVRPRHVTRSFISTNKIHHPTKIPFHSADYPPLPMAPLTFDRTNPSNHNVSVANYGRTHEVNSRWGANPDFSPKSRVTAVSARPFAVLTRFGNPATVSFDRAKLLLFETSLRQVVSYPATSVSHMTHFCPPQRLIPIPSDA